MIPASPQRTTSPSDTAPLTAVGIIAKNSVAFVEAVFQHLQRDTPILLLKGAANSDEAGEFSISKTVDPGDTTGWARLAFTPRTIDQVAQFAFTSGTEGKPKAIAVTHKNLADMVERLHSVMHMDDSIREYIGVPVYHSFGFGRCRAIATLGGAFYVPPNGFNPLEIQQMLARDEINAISAVPSLWRALFENEELFGEETGRIRWIEIGSQYMSAQEKLRLKRLFPNACIVQHYGLTEASRATFLQVHKVESNALLESVGTTVGDTEVRITDDGRIAIRGSVVARRMWRNGRMQPLIDENDWLVTSDLGEIHRGHLFYKGRADDIINCGGVKIVPETLEKLLRQRTGLQSGITCCRVADERRGDGVLVAYLADLQVDPDELRHAAREVLADMNVNIGAALKVIPCESFPTTPTGKIKRKELARLQEHQTASHPHTRKATEAPASPREQELMALWKSLLQIDQIGRHESFLDLGGDSLTAITAIVKMKRMGIPEATCRGILQGKSIAQIVAEEEALVATGQTRAAEALNTGQKNALNIKFVRGLLVLLVIFAHWSEGFFARLPDAMQGLWTGLAPLFSAGTPGFAIMYGVTIGYSFYPTYQKSPARLRSLRRPILWILLAGVLILAGAELLEHALAAGALDATTVGNSLYGVLTYYLLATLSLPAWFWFLSKSGAPAVTALGSAVLLHLFYLQYMMPLGAQPATGFIELAKLLLTAKYSYFNMTSGVFVGVAIGIALHAGRFDFRLPASWLLSAFAVLSAWWLSAVTGEIDQWFVWPASKVPGWKWLFYIGLCLLLLTVVERMLARYHDTSRPLKVGLNIIACIGLLAFPMFVLHELVLPLKNILGEVGLPNAIALGLAMTMFAGCSGYLIYKSYRMQFD